MVMMVTALVAVAVHVAVVATVIVFLIHPSRCPEDLHRLRLTMSHLQGPRVWLRVVLVMRLLRKPYWSVPCPRAFCAS